MGSFPSTFSLKTNIEYIKCELNDVIQLIPMNYIMTKMDDRQICFIVQEVQQIIEKNDIYIYKMYN